MTAVGSRAVGLDATHGSQRHARGFTLIELLLVVTIMMLVVGTVASNIDMVLPASRLEATARQLSADIELARASAVAQGLPYRIEYNLTHPGYRISTPFKSGGGIATTDTDRVRTDWRYFPEGVSIDRIQLGSTVRESVKDSADPNSAVVRIQGVDIRPNGNTVEHVVALLRERPPGKFYLSVQGLTGFVQLYGEDWRPDVVSESDFR